MNREQARDQIKQGIPCTDYLEKSKNNMYCCPYCDSGHGHNGTGAVKYYPATNTWHCHACDRGGDVIDAYTAATGSDYNDALSSLAAQIGITIDSRPTAAQDFAPDRIERPQSDETRQKDKYPDAQEKAPQNADFTAYYRACAGRITDPAAVSYLTGRGISIDTVRRFNVGFDPAADPATAPGAMADEYKAHPTPRIIIPCSQAHYVARSIDPSTPANFKALNPNTQKGGGNVALFNAKAIHDTDAVFITEGIFDALSFIEAGHPAIALNSKGNGKLLLQQLQGTPTDAAFVIVPDNDDNPKTAADTMRRAEELNNGLRAMNLQSIVYNVAGQYHDANDALKADRAAFERGIEAAIHELQRDDITDFLEKVTTEAYKGKETGLRFFDELLGGGVLPQSLLLLLAAPAAGKTTLAAQVAECMAERGEPVIFFNLEMSREQMLAKAISTRLYRKGYHMTAKQILQGYKWNPEQRAQITQTIEEYRQAIYPHLRYNPDNIGSNLENMLQYLNAAGEAAKAKGRPAPAAVVDYLHKLTSSEHTDVAETIKKAVDGFKQYAIKYNTFVITIAAVNRESMKSGRIDIHSGRDSSGIEFEGDYILTMNYKALDSGKVKMHETDKVKELQQAPRREMLLRLNKGRFDIQGKDITVLFDAAHNTFYGTCDDFIPADDVPPFDDDTQTILTI